MTRARRMLGVAACLLGAAGVVLAALAAHAPAPDNGGGDVAGHQRLAAAAAAISLAHAPAVLALVLGRATGSMALIGAGLMVLGAGLFALELGLRALVGVGVWPMLAPLGGALAIGGWVAAALGIVTGFAARER